MALLEESIDVQSLPQATSNFEPLPAGWYTAIISQAELRPTKDGTGNYIKVRYDVTGPTHQGRVVFGNLNLKNASAKAEEIGRAQLGELMRAINLTKISDTDQLIGGTLSIKLDIRAATEKYGAQNDVKAFRAISSGSVPAPQPATAAATGKSAPPWAKK